MNKTIDPLHALPAEGHIRPARSMRVFGRSQLRDLLSRALGRDILSFAIGMPAEETFPTARVAQAAAATGDQASSLQYGLPCAGLKAHVVDLMARRGVACTPDQVFLTSGAQQGIDLLTRLLAQAGDRVMVEHTLYEGARLALASRDVRVVTVASSTEHGLDLDDLEAQLSAGPPPAFLFVIPDGHNPLGVDLPAASRQRLVTLAQRHGLAVIEDDAYGLLRYDAGTTKPLRALDDRWMIYLGTFSKIIAPAFRVGWIVAPEGLLPALSSLKHGSDLDTATFGQRALSRLLDDFDLEAHCRTIRDVYRLRRDTLLDALARHCTDVARWQRPTTGFYVWLELKAEIDTRRLLETALDIERVAFSPGSAFTTDGSSTSRALRLSFARLRPDQIEEGVVRLRSAIERMKIDRGGIASV